MLFRHHMPSMPMTADILLYNNRAVSGESFLAATNAPPRRNLVRIMMAAQHRISAYGLSAVSVLSQRWSETRPCSLLSALSNGPYYNVSLLTTLSKRSFCYQRTGTFVYTQHLKGSFNLRHKICIKKSYEISVFIKDSSWRPKRLQLLCNFAVTSFSFGYLVYRHMRISGSQHLVRRYQLTNHGTRTCFSCQHMPVIGVGRYTASPLLIPPTVVADSGL